MSGKFTLLRHFTDETSQCFKENELIITKGEQVSFYRDLSNLKMTCYETIKVFPEVTDKQKYE